MIVLTTLPSPHIEKHQPFLVMLVYQPGIFPGEIGDIHILRCSHHGVSAAVQVPHGAGLARSHWESTSLALTQMLHV